MYIYIANNIYEKSMFTSYSMSNNMCKLAPSIIHGVREMCAHHSTHQQGQHTGITEMCK